MLQVDLQILNDEGLHARPAGVLAKAAAGFKSSVELEFNGKKANAKSVLSLMTLGLKKDSEFKLNVSGLDEAQAVESLRELVSKRFSI